MNDRPLVSIYIPTKNRLELLKRTVESIKNQSYDNIEIVICDDGSDQYSIESLKGIYKKDPNIKVIKGSGEGACAARNLAISHCSGDYISGMDDDDIMHPERIDRFLKSWDDNYIYLSALSKNKKSRLHGLKSLFDRKKIITSTQLIKRNYVGNQIFCRRTTLEDNKFDENLVALQDWELWYRILLISGKSALILGERLQVIDEDHDKPRISSFENRMRALNQISKKYKIPKTKFSKLITLWKLESGNSISFFDFIIGFSFSSLLFVFNRMIIRKIK